MALAHWQCFAGDGNGTGEWHLVTLVAQMAGYRNWHCWACLPLALALPTLVRCQSASTLASTITKSYYSRE
jgi:hypothetical protein